MKIMRVLRGMLGTALTWGLAWVPLSVGFIGLYALPGAPELPSAPSPMIEDLDALNLPLVQQRSSVNERA